MSNTPGPSTHSRRQHQESPRSEGGGTLTGKNRKQRPFLYHQSITISRDATDVEQVKRDKLAILHGARDAVNESKESEESEESKESEGPEGFGLGPRLQPRVDSNDPRAPRDTYLSGPREPYRGPRALIDPPSRSLKPRQEPSKVLNFRFQKAIPDFMDDRPTTAEDLDEQIADLQRQRHALNATTWLTVHRIKPDRTSYLQIPYWVPDRGNAGLVGRNPVVDLSKYLDLRRDVAFLVIKTYEGKLTPAVGQIIETDDGHWPDPVPVSEELQVVSPKMKRAMQEFWQAYGSAQTESTGTELQTQLQSPFVFWFRMRKAFRVERISEANRPLVQLLLGWIEANYLERFDAIEKTFAEGRVSSDLMPFFMQPGDILVKRGKIPQGFVARSWASESNGDGNPHHTRNISTKGKLYKLDIPDKSAEESGEFDEIKQAVSSNKLRRDKKQLWSVQAWHYTFNGRFVRSNQKLHFSIHSDEKSTLVNMNRLDVVPFRFTDTSTQELLVKHGTLVWECRHRRLVTYRDSAYFGEPSEPERYMVDYETYRQLHSVPFAGADHSEKTELHGKKSDEPPGLPDLVVLPITLKAYALRHKKWEDIWIDGVQNVVWNKQAFQHLVIEDDVKDIVEALITSRLENERSTDVVQGKGNGLIMLLHGGPGTGKTFTAESVADIAEKPLYRVTCGDIGTKPEQVEKYLESVLHLGKIWDCVVLLDEADVFLEQRSLMDLERNALVSVFLRVLEYYEGILILTSNRVTTFDEAFKSRIQLSLHYKPLGSEQRRRIWENFLGRLKSSEGVITAGHPSSSSPKEAVPPYGIDFDDIRRHLNDLAKKRMNGREIRNAITTARQLAKFKRQSMNYSHLEHVIDISQRFDEYLKTEHESEQARLAGDSMDVQRMFTG